MSTTTAALRMVCAMWLVDKATTLDPAQQIWMRKRLGRADALTPKELATLRAPLLAWARAFDTSFATVVERCLNEETTDKTERQRVSGLTLLQRYPGAEAIEQAALMAQASHAAKQSDELSLF